jgi:ribose transport system substrate-binding protein
MSKKNHLSKWIMTLFTMIMLVSLIASCAPAPTPAPAQPAATEAPAQPAATEAPAQPAATEAPAQPAATEAPAQPAGDGKFTIGISNPFISSEYRTQMIQELKDVNAEYMAAGITNELVIESADTDVAGQIQQLQNLMSKNVDAILVNPGDAQGLNATLEEAVKAGILVLSIDQELDVAGAYNVGHNQKEWAMTSAKWLAEKLQEGNVVEIEGFPGHPANEYRMSGVDEVFAGFPGIKVLARETGKWDEATGQQVMSNFLAGFPGQINGVWTQDGMAIGALQAVMAANPPEWPIMVGEGRCQYLKLWEEVKQTRPDFESIGVANAPGVNATGLRIAISILQGEKVDESKLSGQFGTSFIIPIPVIVTGDNFQEWLDFCADKPDQFLLDGIMTEEEVMKAFFVQ